MAALSDVPLVARKTLFGNASHLEPKLSPDGPWLAWLAPVEGVMNVWIAAVEAQRRPSPDARKGPSDPLPFVCANERPHPVRQGQGGRRELSSVVRGP
jgi:hypothetical protein